MMSATNRKHGHNFVPQGENDTHETEISCGDDAPAGPVKVPRIESNTATANGVSPIKGVAKSESEARRQWRNAKAVCFDVDSTVCVDEAIDELAAFLGKGTAVADLTRRAMNEGLSFRQALEQRLDLIKPSRVQLEAFCKANPPRLTPGMKELFRELHQRSVAVFLVSGGFTRIILDVARILNVPEENVHANVLHFDEAGEYAGFDDSQPTSDTGGKPRVCAMLKAKFRYSPLVMVGDGATDMEASPPADAFVGFGANQVRGNVKEGAPWFVTSVKELLDELRRERED